MTWLSQPICRLGSIIVVVLLTACMTPREKRQMQQDVFSLQTRLLTMEQSFADNSKVVRSTGDSTSKRIASTRTELDKIQQDIQRIKGDIDMLKIAVRTGRIPGDATGEESVGARLDSISERLAAVEGEQENVVQAIQSAGGSSKQAKVTKRSNNNAREPITSAKSMQTAFDGKRYLHVVEDGPKVIDEASGKSKQQAQFLYAESLYKLGRLRDAALRFSEFVESKPDKKYLPLAKMRLGDCFRHLGDKDTSKIFYEELVQEFPKSPEAEKARERLSEL